MWRIMRVKGWSEDQLHFYLKCSWWPYGNLPFHRGYSQNLRTPSQSAYSLQYVYLYYSETFFPYPKYNMLSLVKHTVYIHCCCTQGKRQMLWVDWQRWTAVPWKPLCRPGSTLAISWKGQKRNNKLPKWEAERIWINHCTCLLRLRHGPLIDVSILVDLLPQLVVDFLPSMEVLQTVVTEFVSPHQTRPHLAACVMAEVHAV